MTSKVFNKHHLTCSNEEDVDENEQKLDELEDHFNNMETAMNLIVDGISQATYFS